MARSVARRIARGYASLVASLFLVVMCVALAGMVAKQAGDEMTGIVVPRMRQAHALDVAIERLRVGLIRLVWSDHAGQETGRRIVDDQLGYTAVLLEGLDGRDRTPAERAQIQEIRLRDAAVRRAYHEILDARARHETLQARLLLHNAQEQGELMREAAARLDDLHLGRIAHDRNETDRAILFALILATLLAGGSAGLAIANWRRETREVVGPLQELEQAMERLPSGQPVVAAHPDAQRTTELATLQAGFNHMAGQIREQTHSLAEANNTLEARVAEQTAQLRAALEDLQALDKLKSEFMAVVSHELLTPINFIMGFGSALEDELLGPLNPRQQDAVAKLMGGTERLTRMVRNTLAYTQALGGQLSMQLEDVDLDELVHQVGAELEGRFAAKQQALVLDVAPGLAPACADGDRLAHVLRELLGNATEFMPAGGKAVVQVRPAADALTIEVADDGPGMDEEAVSHLFEPFYQADGSSTREHGGLGLGLAIARQFVAAMGGTIVAASVPGGGTRFWLTLPAAPVRSAVT